MNSKFSRRDRNEAKGLAFGTTWLVHAPWAHSAWHSYIVTLVNLNTPVGGKPADTMRSGGTREVLVWAANPEVEIKTGDQPEDWDFNGGLLWPANHGYHFVAESDEDAFARIEVLVKAIEEKLLSPDTDFTSTWDELFRDGVTLKKSIFAVEE